MSGIGGVTVREALPDELAEAGAIVERAYRALPGRPHAAYLAVVRDAPGRAAHCPVLVAVAEGGAGGVLGCVTYVPGPETPLSELAGPSEAEFRMLGVAPGAQGRGVGEALVRACIERARADGRSALVLSTTPRMETAQRLYARLGFRRAPSRDWEPVPGVRLIAYVLEL
jgi:ribosomal protein S18 acetylase RimI-like enzyme